MEQKEFVCPLCKKELRQEADAYLCRECSCKWKIKDGIPVFLKEEIPYWAEIPQVEARAFNQLAQKEGWRKAVESLSSQSLKEYIFHESRINWKYFVPSDVSGVILDAGSGWGSLSFPFNDYCEKIYSLEPAWERINFIKIRRDQDQLYNLVPVCGDTLNLPFPDSYFDVVFYSGVLEWLGTSNTKEKPDDLQKKALAEVIRVLKPGGSLYIGVENRLAFFYFLGVKDPHAGLRFSTLMPRFLADLYSKIVRKKSYREYLYSYNALKRLLKKSGFDEVKIFTPIPSYLNYKYIVPLDSGYPFNYWLKNVLATRIPFASAVLRLIFGFLKIIPPVTLVAVLKYFVPDYAIIAVKSKKQ
ncbi:MAG: methyltransferase domain-containing protein [Candidatus Omnitrophica bacterium]|nr:methyltransferase domain-containing protein [Candidatus Omnitrophota bacterium]